MEVKYKNMVKLVNNSVNFSGNAQVDETRLKKQMKGTKEMARLTFYPDIPVSPYGEVSYSLSFKEYLQHNGIMLPSMT